RQSPHVLRKGRRRMLVQVELENREENAYNASLWLRLPGNLHFSSLVLQVRPWGSPNPRRASLGVPKSMRSLPGGPRIPEEPPQAPIPGGTWGSIATCTLHPPSEGTRVATVPPEDLQHVDRLDCPTARCERLSCRLARLRRGAGVSVRLLRTLHSGFFSAVR
ncbi:ITA10 protein, partial [Sclerurus mexicanus]|nr:ITA10 protein [Sclerurus mexicanus]